MTNGPCDTLRLAGFVGLQLHSLILRLGQNKNPASGFKFNLYIL